MAKLRYLHGDGMELIVCKHSAISYPLHNHISVFALGFVLDGEIELSTDKGTGLYRENGAFVIPPYTPHCLNARSCYTLLSLCVRKELVTGTELEQAIPGIAAFLRKGINRPALEARIIQTLCGLNLVWQTLPTQKETVISRLKTRLETYPECKYSIADMAEYAFVSKYHLIRAFKQEVGLTPHQFQIQNRIRKAQRLLKESVSIAEVASATGFCDQSHFIRHFEKIVGLTPTDYKLSCEVVTPIFVS